MNTLKKKSSFSVLQGILKFPLVLTQFQKLFNMNTLRLKSKKSQRTARNFEFSRYRKRQNRIPTLFLTSQKYFASFEPAIPTVTSMVKFPQNECVEKQEKRADFGSFRRAKIESPHFKN